MRELAEKRKKISWRWGAICRLHLKYSHCPENSGCALGPTGFPWLLSRQLCVFEGLKEPPAPACEGDCLDNCPALCGSLFSCPCAACLPGSAGWLSPRPWANISPTTTVCLSFFLSLVCWVVSSYPGLCFSINREELEKPLPLSE